MTLDIDCSNGLQSFPDTCIYDVINACMIKTVTNFLQRRTFD